MAKQSKTAQAIALFIANQDSGMTVAEAARQAGVGAASVYKRLKLLSETADQRCPCCGQLVPTEK